MNWEDSAKNASVRKYIESILCISVRLLDFYLFSIIHHSNYLQVFISIYVYI